MPFELPYTVACCTPGCTWEQEHVTQDTARHAGDRHEREHAGHCAHLFPPDMTQGAD